jgi:microcystin-dependent protein
MGIGDQADTWGTTANSNLQNVLEAAIAGRAAVVMGNANITLSALNNAPDQSRPRILHVTSSVALTAQRDVIVPSGAGVTKDWIVFNGTTGGFPIRVKTAAGSGVVIPNGQTRQVQADGTNVLPSITGALSWTVDNGLFVTAGGVTITAGGLAVTAGGLTVAAGGAAVTGNSTVTGNLTVTGSLSAGSLASGSLDLLVPIGTLRASAGLSADTGWLLAAGQAVSRTTYAALFAKVSRTLTADTTAGSAVITGTFDVANLFEGMPVSGPGIPVGATLGASITGTSITLSANATATATGVAVVVAPWGVGNGTTTFNLPDFRGRTFVGLDAQNGAAASRVTIAGSAMDARRLGAVGGNQALSAHVHPITDPGHGHLVVDPGHGHPVVDPGHVHASSGSVVYFSGGSLVASYAGPGGGGLWSGPGTLTLGALTGIVVTAAATGITVTDATTGITVGSAGTGASANIPPAAACFVYIKF